MKYADNENTVKNIDIDINTETDVDTDTKLNRDNSCQKNTDLH